MTRCKDTNDHDLRCVKPSDHNNAHKYELDKPGGKFLEGRD